MPILSTQNYLDYYSTVIPSGGGMNIGGRLSLVTATPIMLTSQAAKTTIYFPPYKGQSVPIYDGTNMVMTDFGGELSQATTDSTKSPAAMAAESNYDMFVWNDGGTFRCTRGPAWSLAATVTMTIATPCVVTWNGHGLREGAPVVFTTTNTLPTGITAGTIYYVSRSPLANSFNVSTSIANAATGTLIATSGSQSGVHTGTNSDTSRGTGAGTTELEMIKGYWLNKNSITNGPAADRGTFVGTVRSNASSQMDWSITAAPSSGGTACALNICNYYNPVLVSVQVRDSKDSWGPGTASTWRSLDASTTNRVSFVQCFAENTLFGEHYGLIVNAASNGWVGIGDNCTNAMSGITTGVLGTLTGSALGMFETTHIGYGYFQAIEYPNTAPATIYGDLGVPTFIQEGLHFRGMF